jgi:hypothetical protein
VKKHKSTGSCEKLNSSVKPDKAFLAPLRIEAFESAASWSETGRNAVGRRAHAHKTRRHRCAKSGRRHRWRHGVWHHTSESRRLTLLLGLEDVGHICEALGVTHVRREARRRTAWGRTLVLERWRLQEREVWRELRLLLGWHARHTGVATHATVLRWLLLLRLDEVAALLHLLLHEHGVLFVHARRCACGSTLR